MGQDIGKRIRRFREDAGLTQAQLGNAVGLDHTAVSKVEGGKRRVSAREVVDFAEALGVRTRDLTSERAPSPAIVFAHRLGQAEEDGGSAGSARAAAMEVLEVKALMDDLTTGPRSPHGYDTAQVQVGSGSSQTAQGSAMAGQVREIAGLGSSPVGDLPHLLAQFGVLVIGRPFGANGIDGLCAEYDGQMVAVVNTGKWPTRQRFTLAHEFGHLLAGDAVNDPVTDTSVFDTGGDATESRANAFAAELLVPLEVVANRIPNAQAADSAAIADLVFDYDVSVQTAYWRLVSAGIVERPEDGKHPIQELKPGRLAWEFGRQQQFRRQLQQRGTVLVPEKLQQQAISAYQAGEIGLGPLVRLTQQESDELRAQLHDDGIVPDLPDMSDAMAAL